MSLEPEYLALVPDMMRAMAEQAVCAIRDLRLAEAKGEDTTELEAAVASLGLQKEQQTALTQKVDTVIQQKVELDIEANPKVTVR